MSAPFDLEDINRYALASEEDIAHEEMILGREKMNKALNSLRSLPDAHLLLDDRDLLRAIAHDSSPVAEKLWGEMVEGILRQEMAQAPGEETTDWIERMIGRAVKRLGLVHMKTGRIITSDGGNKEWAIHLRRTSGKTLCGISFTKTRYGSVDPYLDIQKRGSWQCPSFSACGSCAMELTKLPNDDIIKMETREKNFFLTIDDARLERATLTVKKKTREVLLADAERTREKLVQELISIGLSVTEEFIVEEVLDEVSYMGSERVWDEVIDQKEMRIDSHSYRNESKLFELLRLQLNKTTDWNKIPLEEAKVKQAIQIALKSEGDDWNNRFTTALVAAHFPAVAKRFYKSRIHKANDPSLIEGLGVIKEYFPSLAKRSLISRLHFV
jgi:hypothetical protein